MLKIPAMAKGIKKNTMIVLSGPISQHSDGSDFPNNVSRVTRSPPAGSFSVQQKSAGMPFVTSGKSEDGDCENPSSIKTVRTYFEINSCGL
jgi:hypothetical protein